MGGAIFQGCKRYSYLCLLGSDKGKEGCGKARKLGLLYRVPVILLMANKAPAVPATAPVLGRAPGAAATRAVPDLPGQSSAEEKGAVRAPGPKAAW